MYQHLNKHISDGSILLNVNEFFLLYADDTVIIADSAKSLQYALDIYAQYCNDWTLKLNVCKTKTLIYVSITIYNDEQIKIVRKIQLFSEFI